MDSTSANENQTSSRPSPVNASPQVYVITPNQLAKLGLSTQIHSLIATQVQSQQTAVEMESIIFDNNEEQSLNISSSTASSHFEGDRSSTLTENKISIETRKLVNAENVIKENTSSSLRNEMKSKLHYLLNTNEAENINMSVIKDSNKIHILNYATPTPSANFGAMHSTLTDKRNICDTNPKIISAHVSTTTAEQRKPGIADGTEIRYRTLLTKQLSHDSIAKQQTVKPAPRIINSKSFPEATKTTPVKLEIVSNEVVNFSPLEIQNILKQNVPSQSKVTESIPQSTSNTINKTAYLQNSLCTQDSTTNNAAVEKQSNDIGDKVINLGNSPEECSDDRSQKIIENDTLNLPRLQTINICGNTKDKNSFLPPINTFVVRQAQVQILNSSEIPTEQIKPECTNEEKAVSEKLLVEQDAQTDSKLDTNTETLEREHKKAAIPINNNTELKVTENRSAQKLTYPTLLNSLLQKRTYIGATSNINISDHSSLNVLNRAVGLKVEENQPEAGLENIKGNNFTEGQTKEINRAPEFSEKNKSSEIVEENSVDEQELESFTSETSLRNNYFQTEQVRKVEKPPPPRILNLELQEKIDVSLEIEKRQYKAGVESPNKNNSKEGQIKEICATSEFPEKLTPTDIDKNAVNELDSENLTSEKALLSDDSQTEQDTKVEKAPAPPPRVLNLELQERKKVITDKSFFDSTAANSCNQKKLQVDSCGEQQKSGAASIVLNSKLHQDFLKKVNTLATEPNPTKSHVINKIRYKLLSITKNENFRKDNTRCYGKKKTVNIINSDDSSVEHNSDSDKVASDDATTPKLKRIKKINTSATVEKAYTLKTSENSVEKSIQQSSQSDLIIIDADETTQRRNTKREQEEKALTLKTPTDIDLYVQSKTSGRKRKYVDYKILSGISRYSSSDSDSSDEDTPTKKCATDKPTDTNNQEKSTAEINPVKKRGRGRPRKSEINLIESNKQVQLDTSDVDVLNSETEKQCDSPTLVKYIGRGRPKKFEIKSSECNKEVQLDISDSDVLNLETDSPTLVKHTGRGRPKKSEIKSSECNKEVQLDTSYSDVLNSETDSPTLVKYTGRDCPKKSEIKFSEDNKEVQLDTSDDDVLNLETEKQRDSPTLVKHTGRDRPKKSEIKSSEDNKEVQLDTSNDDVLNLETEKQRDSPVLVKHIGRGRPRKSEIKSSKYHKEVRLDDVVNPETEKQCDSPTLAKHIGRGRPRKSEINYSECNKQVHFATSDSDVLSSETEKRCDSSTLDKRTGRGRPRKLGIKPNECNKQVKLETSDSDALNLKPEKQCDSSTPDKYKGRGRPRKSEIKLSERKKQIKLDSSGGDVLNSKIEKQCDSSTLDKHTGRGRPRKSEIKSNEYNKQVKRDTSDSDVLNLETEKQCDSSTLDNHSSVQPAKKRNLQRTSIVTSTPEKKLRGRRGRRSIIEKPGVSDGVKSNSETEESIDSPTPDSPKSKSTSVSLSKSTKESEPTEKRLRSYTKILLEKMNSAEKNSSTEKNVDVPQKKQETERKANSKNSNSKKDLHLKSVEASKKDSEPIVEKKRRGSSKKKVETEELNTMDNKIEPDHEIKSERKGRGRLRKTQESIDNKAESSERVSPKKISENDDKIEVKKKRGRPKKINNDNSQSPENKTEIGKNKTRSESKKPKIAEVNLSEDRVNSDIDLSNSNLNSSTDPLDIESIPDDQIETGSDTNMNCTKDSPGDTSEKKIKSTEKKRRGRSKAVVNESELKCEAEIEKNPQNVNTDTESKLVKEEKNICEAEPKTELEIADTIVKPQKRRGRKRKINTSEKKLEQSNSVTCAVCKSVLEESQWITHSELKHNNLAWKTNEVPLDLNDLAVVERILSDLYKIKKVLHCELCGCEIQTLPGYKEHKKNCTQKSDDDITEPATKKKLISSVLDSLFSNISAPTKKEESASTESTSAKEEAAVSDSNFVEEILPPLGANDIRCAVCKDVMPKGQWPSHKQRKHNNLAWKVGEKPLNLNDRSVVMRILTDLCKSKKPLLCEVCGVGKKSVLGYLSHKSQCQKSDSEINALKVTCKLCGRSMLPVSLQRHIALSHSVNVLETDSPSLEPIVHESDPQGKRKAANKAAGLIHSFAKDMLNEVSSAKFKKYVKNVNFRSVEAAIYKFSEDIQKQSYTECVFDECNYRTSEHEDLFYHIENCDKNSDSNYTCNFCLATFRARQSVRDHIKLLHSNNENRALISQFSDNEFNSESEDDYENDYTSDSELINAGGENLEFLDVDVVNRPRKKEQALSSGKSTNHRVHFLQRKTKKPQSIYLNAYWWMEKFCQENYRLQNCFPRIYCKKEDWIQLDPTQIINYLPKLRYSVDTARIRINNIVNPICYEYVWKKYRLFESETLSDDGSSIFFCGGPINALAWVPTPHTESNCDQILAVSVTPDPNEKYNTNAVYKDAGLIQFWNIGVLQNTGISTYQPKLEFSIAHQYGVIWAMEWCPSGCYDLIMTDDVKRLGLLAIACSNSFVYIYLVPHPGQVSGSIFKTKPTYKLQLENFTDLTVGEIDYYSTRLSWCKTYGHQFLAVGYSNGVVAVYDLKTEASLLKKEIDGVITLQPTQKFRPHLDAITALCLYHMHDGKRWLLTGSLDRDCKLWDLENISEPINYCKKFVITDAVWLVHWLCSVYSYDHGCISGAVPTSLNPARDFFASSTTFMPSNSRVTSITANEWANLFIQANDCGEVICGFPDQLLQGYDCDKKKSLRKSRCLASYTGMVPKSIPASERIKLETAKLQILKNQHSNSSAGKSPKKQPAHSDVNNESCEARTYFEAEKKYGLVFCDLNMDYKLKEPTVELDKLLQSTHYFSLAKPDMYPLQSITKVTSNPNKNSFLYYACGYQVGIVRVSNLRFLCPENERNALLH